MNGIPTMYYARVAGPSNYDEQSISTSTVVKIFDSETALSNRIRCNNNNKRGAGCEFEVEEEEENMLFFLAPEPILNNEKGLVMK